MAIFFTADTHFDDPFAIEYFHRPFQSVDEMNQAMVKTWNHTVTPEDTVYHLGDFTLEDFHHFTKWASQLNGNIKVLPGSHDDPWLKDFVAGERVQVIAPLVSVQFPEFKVDDSPLVIVLCHYSMQSNQGAWHLFGHSHGALTGIGLSLMLASIVRGSGLCRWEWSQQEWRR